MKNPLFFHALNMALILASCANGSGQQQTLDWLSQMRADQVKNEGPVWETISNFLSVCKTGDDDAIRALLDNDLIAVRGFSEHRLRASIEKGLPRNIEVMAVFIRVENVSGRKGVWLLETIVRYEMNGATQYRLWYFVRRRESLYLRTIPFLEGPGWALDNFEVSFVD